MSDLKNRSYATTPGIEDLDQDAETLIIVCFACVENTYETTRVYQLSLGSWCVSEGQGDLKQ